MKYFFTLTIDIYLLTDLQSYVMLRYTKKDNNAFKLES